jgi:lipopolysaccharide transport system ATP-binding protein
MLISRNKDGMPLATFSNGHYYGDIQHLKIGAFTIDKDVELPQILNKGIIMVDLLFHHPMVEFLLKAPSCCTLDCEGFQTEFGKSCDQTVNGFMGLNSF